MLERNKKYSSKPTTKEELERMNKMKKEQVTNLKACEGPNIKKSYWILRKGNRNKAQSYQIQTIQTATRLILSNLGFLKVVVCKNWQCCGIGDSNSAQVNLP